MAEVFELLIRHILISRKSVSLARLMSLGSYRKSPKIRSIGRSSLKFEPSFSQILLENLSVSSKIP